MPPSQYMAAALALQPDFIYALADETFAPLTKRRADNAVKRSEAWLQQCCDLASAAAAPDGPSPAMIGTVAGAAVQQSGRFVAQSVVRHDSKLAGACGALDLLCPDECSVHPHCRAGYYLAGHGLGESPDERQATLDVIKQDLPAGKPRFVSGVGGLEEMIDCVAAGVDVIESRSAAFSLPQPVLVLAIACLRMQRLVSVGLQCSSSNSLRGRQCLRIRARLLSISHFLGCSCSLGCCFSFEQYSCWPSLTYSCACTVTLLMLLASWLLRGSLH